MAMLQRTYLLCPFRDRDESLDILTCVCLLDGASGVLVRHAKRERQALREFDLSKKQSNRLTRGESNFLEHGLGTALKSGSWASPKTEKIHCPVLCIEMAKLSEDT